jgi:hypothetical protein
MRQDMISRKRATKSKLEETHEGEPRRPGYELTAHEKRSARPRHWKS